MRTSRWYSAALGADMRATASKSSDTREVWPASAVTRLYTSTRSPTPLHEVRWTGQDHNMHQNHIIMRTSQATVARPAITASAVTRLCTQHQVVDAPAHAPRGPIYMHCPFYDQLRDVKRQNRVPCQRRQLLVYQRMAWYGCMSNNHLLQRPEGNHHQAAAAQSAEWLSTVRVGGAVPQMHRQSPKPHLEVFCSRRIARM